MLENASVDWNTSMLDLISLVCAWQTPTKLVVFLTLVLCCWTHPRYYESRIARIFRVPLAIMSATWWSYYPFAFAVKPLSTNFRSNLSHLVVCYVLVAKCLDWGLFSGPQTRRKFVKTTLTPLTGSWQVAEKEAKTTLGKLNNLIAHILFQCTSLRGLQYPWGHFSRLNRNSLMVDFARFIIFQTYSLMVVATIVNRENVAYRKMQHESRAFGLNVTLVAFLLEHWKDTLMMITGLCATFEALQSFLAVVAHGLHPQLNRLGAPEFICEFFDPIYYPPLFGNPLQTYSLAEFWGKTWHQALRRSFIVLGAFPLGGLSAALGFGAPRRKTAGFVGAFIASGFLHACPFFFMSQSGTSAGSIPLQETISVFLCFLIQALGSLVEEKVVQFIPKWLGGGRIWTMVYLLLTLPMFSHPVSKPGRLATLFDPVEKWGLYDLVFPIIITQIVLK